MDEAKEFRTLVNDLAVYMQNQKMKIAQKKDFLRSEIQNPESKYNLLNLDSKTMSINCRVRAVSVVPNECSIYASAI
jgi:hypothetical protein